MDISTAFVRARALTTLAAVTLVVSLAACGSSDGGEQAADATASPRSVATTTPPEPTTTTIASVVETPTTVPTTVAPASTSTEAVAPPPSTAAPTAPPTVPPVPIEEVYATLAPPVEAWAAQPSGPGYEAIASAARALLASGRPLVDLPDAPAGQLGQTLQALVTYPGSDTLVLASLAALGPAAPQVTLPPPPTAPMVQFADTGSDPRFGTCREAKANGYGPYRRGATEYGWYDDRDDDGVVCE
jgi:hypothetical protein